MCGAVWSMQSVGMFWLSTRQVACTYYSVGQGKCTLLNFPNLVYYMQVMYCSYYRILTMVYNPIFLKVMYCVFHCLHSFSECSTVPSSRRWDPFDSKSVPVSLSELYVIFLHAFCSVVCCKFCFPRGFNLLLVFLSIVQIPLPHIPVRMSLTPTFVLIFFYFFVLGSLARFPSELIWNYGLYKVGRTP
jgi:hypothetical protein